MEVEGPSGKISQILWLLSTYLSAGSSFQVSPSMSLPCSDFFSDLPLLEQSPKSPDWWLMCHSASTNCGRLHASPPCAWAPTYSLLGPGHCLLFHMSFPLLTYSFSLYISFQLFPFLLSFFPIFENLTIFQRCHNTVPNCLSQYKSHIYFLVVPGSAIITTPYASPQSQWFEGEHWCISLFILHCIEYGVWNMKRAR